MKLHTALSIAGTDPSGGAGIMADLKSFQSRSVYGMAVITSVVAQNTIGVQHVEHMSLESIGAQLEAVYSDIPPQAVKTGMIASKEMMELIYPYLVGYETAMARGFTLNGKAVTSQSVNRGISGHTLIPYVMDPVMITTSGHRLIAEEAVHTLMDKLIPLATVITPNRMEAEVLANMTIDTEEDVHRAAQHILRDLGPQSVVIKGGHIGDDATDYLFLRNGEQYSWSSPKIDTVHTHGTGCTYSAVITAELAKGRPLVESVATAKQYIAKAIAENPGLGHGHGPVNHMAYTN